MYTVPQLIGEKQLYRVIHSLYFRAGLARTIIEAGYDLRVHLFRKFFRKNSGLV
jgi:hypothetical protein